MIKAAVVNSKPLLPKILKPNTMVFRLLNTKAHCTVKYRNRVSDHCTLNSMPMAMSTATTPARLYLAIRIRMSLARLQAKDW